MLYLSAYCADAGGRCSARRGPLLLRAAQHAAAGPGGAAGRGPLHLPPRRAPGFRRRQPARPPNTRGGGETTQPGNCRHINI